MAGAIERKLRTFYSQKQKCFSQKPRQIILLQIYSVHFITTLKQYNLEKNPFFCSNGQRSIEYSYIQFLGTIWV